MKPSINFEGTLVEITLRKKVDGKPPLYIYDAVFDVTGEDPLLPVQIHRHGPTSLDQKLGQTFRIQGATIRFEHGDAPGVVVRECIEALRGHAKGNPGAKALLDYITGLQVQLAQTRMVIQVSDVKEI